MPCAKKEKKKVKEKNEKFEVRPLSSALASSESQSAYYFYFGRKDVKVSFNHSEGKCVHL